jgi:hypothetical protein
VVQVVVLPAVLLGPVEVLLVLMVVELVVMLDQLVLLAVAAAAAVGLDFILPHYIML